MPLGHHIVFRLVDNRVIAPSVEQRRLVARAVLALACEDELLAFGLADSHLHLLPGCGREAAGQLARRLEISLGQRLALEVGFAPAYIKPVEDGRHLYRAFTYVLEQNTHQGLAWDPLHEASNLPDLLGLRLLGAYSAGTVRRRLPRVKREDLLACIGVDDLQPMNGPAELVTPAALASAALPELRGKSPEALAARRAAVQVLGCRARPQELALLFGVTQHAIHELKRRPADARLVQAIRLQLGLMQRRAEALRQLAGNFEKAS